jgi:pimeloyl-ACP methyl ester carboxylesterase
MPTSGSKRPFVAVICSPVGHEYERCHRALRQLSANLAEAGFPSLRFDYSGCGDSDGGVEDISPASWPGDVETAIETAKRGARVNRAILVGLRLGATIARRFSERDDVAAIVLWNEVSGSRMLREWDDEEARVAKAFGRLPSPETSVQGWPLSKTWREEIRQFSGPERQVTSNKPILRIHRAGAEADSSLEQSQVSTYLDGGPPIWLQEPMQAIVPFATIRHIVDWAVSHLRD